jgi:hypothetical protein
MRLALASTATLLLALGLLAVAPAPATAYDCEANLGSTIGFVCYGTYWCDSGGICAQEMCVFETRAGQFVCVLSPP